MAHEVLDSKPTPPAPVEADTSGSSRRGFLRSLPGAAAVTAGLGALAAETVVAPRAAHADDLSPNPEGRRQTAWNLRRNAAILQKDAPVVDHPCNGDEAAYSDLRAQFSKGLPHNSLGEVDRDAYEDLLVAIASESSAEFNKVPLGGTVKLANPQAGKAFELIGQDSHRHVIPNAPAFASAWQAGEMVEVYWRALTRDVPFIEYASDPLVAAAIEDLNGLSDFRGPKFSGQVVLNTLFRGQTAGDQSGPIVSQFLWQPIPFGPAKLDQKYASPVAGDDHMTDYDSWLAIQRGVAPATTQTLRSAPRYIATGRDIAEWVHRDFTYQGFLNAALILLGYGSAALDTNNPYLAAANANQAGFITFGGPDILDLVAKAANAALRAAWYQKWSVHRKIRPEAFAGRVHNQITGAKNYGIHADVLNSDAAARVFSANGNYLLPMAYPEGSPTHPAYPAGHATIAGACTTVLKWFFNEAFTIPNPVQSNADGSALEPYTGGLIVGGELNKLAFNVAANRDTAGVHWRTDGEEGLKLGEKVAIALIRDHIKTYTESPRATMPLTTFAGQFLFI